MLPVRILIGALFLMVLLSFNGCSTTGKQERSYKARYRIASNECIRFGLRRGSYDYNKCIERRLNTRK